MENAEEEDGVTMSKLRLSEYLKGSQEMELECEATLTNPDISLTSKTLRVKLVGQSSKTLNRFYSGFDRRRW